MSEFFAVQWDGQEYGSGYPSFIVWGPGPQRGEDSDGRAGSYLRWFDSREAAEAHCAEKNGRARCLLSELLCWRHNQ